MDKEAISRNNHRSGNNCAVSVFSAFAEELTLTGDEARKEAPAPRTEGGKCGAYLAGKRIIERLSSDKLDEFDRGFTNRYGNNECRALLASHRSLNKSCNDFVGETAKLVERLLFEM